MTKRPICLGFVLLFVLSMAGLSHGALVLQIGDRDGFGFSPEEVVGAVSISGDPADTDGDGKLEAGEFLPEINGNDSFNECPPPDGDGFDHRSDEEKGATNGAQFTDVSYESGEGGECLGHIPANTTYFEWDFSPDDENSTLFGLPIESVKLRLIYSDFDGDCPKFSNCDEICNDVYADGILIGKLPLTSPAQGGIGRAAFDVPVELLDDDFLRITFESSDSIEFDVAILKMKPVTEDVKPLVRLRKRSETVDPSPVPGGPGGTYVVEYRMRNKSTTPIYAPVIQFVPKNEDILLLNADGGPTGRGATLTPDVGGDVTLSPGEKVLFRLVIGLLDPIAEVDYKLKVQGTPIE